MTIALSSAWIWSASEAAASFFPPSRASGTATALPARSFSLPGEVDSTDPPSLEPELIPPANPADAGGSGSSVFPLVWPMVTYTFAMNLCRFSTTSLVITSGHPTWFAGLVSIGRNTSFASTERCSSGTSPKSPYITVWSTLSGLSSVSVNFRKHSVFLRNFSGGFKACAWTFRVRFRARRRQRRAGEMRRTTRRSARAARESPRPKMRGRDRERIGADRAGRRWKTRATRRSRARRLGKSHRYGTHRREVRVGENQQALGRLVVQERLHRDARGFVVHQRIGRFRLALERRHHARLEPVLQDVIGIPLDLLRGLLFGHRGRLRAHEQRAFDPAPLGDALRPPRTIPPAAVLFLN